MAPGSGVASFFAKWRRRGFPRLKRRRHSQSEGAGTGSEPGSPASLAAASQPPHASSAASTPTAGSGFAAAFRRAASAVTKSGSHSSSQPPPQQAAQPEGGRSTPAAGQEPSSPARDAPSAGGSTRAVHPSGLQVLAGGAPRSHRSTRQQPGAPHGDPEPGPGPGLDAGQGPKRMPFSASRGPSGSGSGSSAHQSLASRLTHDGTPPREAAGWATAAAAAAVELTRHSAGCGGLSLSQDGGPSSAIGSYNSSHDTKTGQLRYQSVRSRASGSGDGHGPGNSSRTSLTGLQAAKESYRGEVAEFGPFGPRSAPLASEPTGGSTSRTTSLSLVPGPGSGGRVGPPTRSTSGEALRGVASTAGGRMVLAGTRFASPHVSTAVSASGGTPEDERTPQSGGHQGVPSSAGRRYGSGSQPHLSHQRPISSTSVISASSSKPLHRHSRPPSHQSHAPASSQGSQGYSARHRHPAHFAHHTVHHAHHAGHHPHPAHSRPGSSRLLSRSIAGAEAPPAHRHASMPTLLARGGASTVLANNQLRRAMLAKYQSYYDDHTADGQEDSSGEEDGGGAASAGDGAGRAAGEGEGETGQEQELDERSTAARAAATLLASASSAAAAGRSRSRSAHPQQPRGALLATVSRRRTQPTSTHPYDLYDIASDSNASGGDVLGSTADGQTMAMAVATATAAAAAAGAGASSDEGEEGEEEDAMGSASGLTRHKSSSSAALGGGGTRAGGGGGSGLAAFALARGLPTNQSFTGANGGGADVLGGGGNAGGGGGGARAGSAMANAALHRRALRAAVACRWRAALQDAQRVVSQPGTPLAQSPRGGTPLDRSRRGSEAGSSGQASEPASPPRTPTVTGELPATSSAAATASIPEPQGPGSGPLTRPGKLSRVSSARNMLPRASLPLAATGSVDGPGSGPHNGLSAGVGGSALGGFSRCPSIARPATTLGTIVSPSVSGAAPGNAPPVLTTTASAAFSRLQLMKEPFAPGAPFPFGQALNASVAGEPALAPAPGLLLRSSSQRVGVPSGGLALRRSFAPSAGSDAPSLASPGGPASLLVSAAPSPMPNRRSSMTSAAPSPLHAGRAGGASAAPSPLPTARLNVWSRRASWHSTGSHAPGVPLVLEHEEGCCDPDVQAADSPPHTPRASSNGAAATEAAAAIAAAAAAAVAAANTEGVHSSPSDEAGDFFCKSLSVAPDTRPGSGSIGHTVSSAGASGSAVTLVSPPPSSAGQSANSARALGVGAWAVAAAAVAMPAVFGAFLAPEVAAGLLALLAAAVLAAEAAAIARPASGRRSSSGWLAQLAAARGSFGASLAAGVLVAPALSKPTQLVAAMPAWASGLALLTVTVLACVAATALLGAWAMQGRQRGLRMVTVVSAPGQARASGSVAASSQLSSSAVVVTAAPSATDAAASDASAELAWLARQHTLLSAVKMRMIAEDDVAGIVRTLAAYVAELYDGFGAFLLMTLPPGEGDDLMDLEGSNGEGTNPGGEGGHHGAGMSGSGAKPPPLAVLVPLAHCPDLKPWMRRAISEEDSGRAKEGDGEDQHQGHEDDDDDGFVALGDLPTLLACLDEHAAACFADLNPPPPAPDFAPAAAAAEARLDPGFTPTATADFSHRAAAAAGGGSAGAGAGGSGSPDNDGPSSAEAYATPPAGTPRPFSSSGMGRSSPPSPMPRPGSPWAPPPDMVVLGDHLSASGFLVAPIQCLEHSFGLLLVARPKARRVVSGGPGASGSAGSSPESNSGGGAGAGSSSQGGQRAAQGVSHHEEEPPPLDESLFELSCCLADELAAVLYMKHLEAEMAVSELLMADIMPHDAIQLLKRRHLKNLAVGAGSGSFTVGPVNTGGPASPTANARNSTGGPGSGPSRHRRRGSAQPPSLANAPPPPLPPAPTPRHGLTPSPSMASIMGPPCLTPSVSISTHTNSFTTSLAGGASMYGGGYTSGITVGGSQRGGAASFSHPTSGIALGSVSSLSFGSSTGPSFTRSPSVPAWQQQQPLSPPLPPLHEGMPTSNEDSGPNPFTQAGPNAAAAAAAVGPGSAGPSSAVERMGSGLTSRASEGARVLRRQGSSFGVSSLPLSRVNSIPRSPSGSATGGAEDSSINGGSNGGGALSASSAGAVANRAAAATAAAAASAAAVSAAAAVNATVNAASTVSASAVAASTAATAGSATGLSSSAEHAERTLGPDRTSALSGRTGTMPSDCGAEPYTEDLDRFWGNRSSAPERALPSDLSSRPSNMAMSTYTNVPYMAGGSSTNGSPSQLTPRNSVPAMVSASVSTNAGGFSPPLLTMPRTQSASGWRAPAVRALVSRRPPAATRASHSGVTGTTAGAAFGTAAAVQHNSSSVHVSPVGMYRTSSDAMHEAEREAASAGGTGAGAEVERPMSGGRLPGAPYHMGGLRPSSVRAPLPGLDEMRSFGRGENVITAADFELDGVPLPSMGEGGSQAGEAEAAGAEGEADGAGGRRGSNEGERQLTPRAGPRSAGGGGAEGGGGGGGWHSSGSRDGTPPPAARRHARRSLHIPGNSSSGSGGLLVSGSGVILHAPILYRDASAATAATPMPPLATRTSERLQAHFPSLLRRSVTDMAYSMLPSGGLNGLAGLGAGTSSEGLPPTPTWAARHLSWRPTQHPAAAVAASSPFGTLVPGQPLDSPRITGSGGAAGAAGGAAALGGGAGSDTQGSWGTQSAPGPGSASGLAAPSPTATPTMTPPVDVPYKQWHTRVSVLFADIVGYTNMARSLEPEQVMEVLHSLFSRYDDMLGPLGVYKVETIGDAYMAATGLLHQTPDHAANLVSFGLGMIRAAANVLNPVTGEPLRIRVGINSGPVMSGIVGACRARYALFGDTVNTASRMESTGCPGCIQITEDTYLELPEAGRVRWSCRGEIEVKGKGRLKTYLLDPAAPVLASAFSVSGSAAGGGGPSVAAAAAPEP
ncbi:hypothetical protein HYH03_001445 [Edaphochlamys debaryana]|uniref:Guanylate cyclase domain-containing protein n=1 Tax=Edaphochlamys debaryana TaxID=47281 RepID=A0A836C693_9CHLO|nr:hypothetical protein HYH03_001445 [Edaphochlamys debaryana]|eukprot:KAG2500679.1 hypothetical protein HYH03_001445 [Edaphochlamys debaryana]